MPLRALPALVLALALGVPSVAAAVDPQTTTANALVRFVNDTRGLTGHDASAKTRRALVSAAGRIGQAAQKRPCRAVRLIRAYRKRLSHVRAVGRMKGTASLRGTLERDALAVDAGLKQQPRTRRCGGGATQARATIVSRVRRSSRRQLKLHVTLPVARWGNLSGGGRDFIGLNMDNGTPLGSVGDPAVPAFTRMFAVPRGASLSVKVAHVRGYTLDGITLYPKQEEAMDGAPPPGELPPATFADKPFKISHGAYRGRGALPRRLAYARILGRMRDVRVGVVQVPGAQYDARKRRARVFTSMDVIVKFKHPGRWEPSRRRSVQEAAFRRMYRTSLDNYRSVPANKASAAQAPACGEDFLIVTTPALHNAAAILAEAKQNAGMRTKIQDFEAGTPAADIRTFIRGEINSTTCLQPTYAVIIGDTAQIPTFSEQFCSDPATCTVSSDLSYSLDGVGTDPFADVLLGRIPAPNAGVAEATVKKIVTYETELPAPPGDDFYNHATVTENFDGLGPKDGRGFTLSAERMRAGLRSRGHVVTRLTSAQPTADIQLFKDNTPIPDELKPPNTLWDDTHVDVVNELNAGRFLVVHRDHGSRFSWNNPTFTINDIDSLNSSSTKLPVVISVDCSSASFQFPGSPSLDERLLQRVGGGAVAAIGDDDISPTTQNDLLTVGYADAMFPDTVPTFGNPQPLTRLGEVMNAGKFYMASQVGAAQQLTGNTYKELLIWHLLGDPSMEIRTATPTAYDPAQLSVKFQHRTDSYPVGDPPFRVRVASTQPGVDGTLVTLKHAGEAIGQATMSGGVALITPTKRTDSASLSVSLVGDGFLQKEVTVPAPVPTLTMTCPANVDVPQQTNGIIRGTVSPKVSGATVQFKVTRANGTVTTHSTQTLADSTYAIKIPMAMSDIGNPLIQAFYDGALKYGADDVSCTFPVF